MLFEQPASPIEAVRALMAKQILPTTLDTDGIRQWTAWLRNQSLFSAQTYDQYLLELYRTLLQSLLSGDQIPEPGGQGVRAYNVAYARAAIQGFLRARGYLPPEGKAGTIEDLSSDVRVSLVLETNRDLGRGQGYWLAGQDQVALDLYPGLELFRAEARMIPRNWLNRWQIAGAATGTPIGSGWTITPDKRLIALKNHPIWQELGSSKNFNDALDTAWPPFAFRSGMWTRQMPRKAVEAIGLIKPGEKVAPMSLQEALKN